MLSQVVLPVLALSIQNPCFFAYCDAALFSNRNRKRYATRLGYGAVDLAFFKIPEEPTEREP